MIDPEVESILERELVEGEELLWSGQPQGAPFLKRYLFLLWPGLSLLFNPANLFLFFFTGFVSFLIFQHISIICGQIYAVTDKRVLILHKAQWLGHIEIKPRRPVWITIKGNAQKGTIWFSDEMPMLGFPPAFKRWPEDGTYLNSITQMWIWSVRANSTAFFNIPNPQDVIPFLPISVMPNR